MINAIFLFKTQVLKLDFILFFMNIIEFFSEDL